MKLSFAAEMAGGSIIFFYYGSGANPLRFQVEEGIKNGNRCVRFFYPSGGPPNLIFILFLF
jgi:hypothetical protein